MDLEDVRQFAVVARLGSFSGASKDLGIARSTLTRVVQRVEAEVGVALLHRSTRRVVLTAAGGAFLDRVRPALHDIEQAVEDLRADSHEPSGVLRVSASNDVAVSLLGPVLTALAMKYPRLRIETVLTLRPVDLVGEQIDVALRTYRDRPSDEALTGRRLRTLAFGWYASPEYLGRRGVPTREADLLAHDVVAVVRTSAPCRFLLDDSLFGLALVRSGGGVGLLPQGLCADDVARGTLVRVVPEVAAFEGELWLVYPSGPISLNVAAFRDVLVAHLASAGQQAG